MLQTSSLFQPDLANSVACAAGLVLAAGFSYYLTKKPHVIDPLYDFANQSVEIDPVERIRVCKSIVGKPLIEYRFDDVRTVYDVLRKGKELSNDGPCIGKREGPNKGPYTWTTYSQVMEQLSYIGSGLLNRGIESNNLTHIGIYSANRNEWIIAEHACYSQSFPVVSLYDSYGKSSIKYVLNHAEIKALFVDNYERLMNIMEIIEDVKFLELIVYFDDLTAKQHENVKKLNTANKSIISFQELMDEGKKNVQAHHPPKPSDVATICYTSGTTGMPKGALITHLNIISSEAALHQVAVKPHLNQDEFNPRRVHLSFLPLAHMLARESSIFVFLGGGRVGFLSGTIQNLPDDIQELKPTDVAMVPRLLNRIYNQVMGKVENDPIKKFLLHRAIAAKNADRKKGIYRKNTIYDMLVFNKIRARFGGRICRMATGSAPISNQVLEFSKAVFGCPLPEGYGQTESTTAITFTHPLDPDHGHCGPPVACLMVKLVDVPEMGYFANESKGEICAKGPSRFKGYFKDEEKTKEAIDNDGWLHTGDIGMWLPNGTLKIIDRKKNLFKLSQGEYISPEKIENVYLRSPFIAQIIIDGNSLKDFIVAIVVPEVNYLLEYCKEAKIEGNFTDLCKNQKIKEIIYADLVKFRKIENLMSYEQVKNIYLHDELFSLENGLATPTMKIVRHEVRRKFKDTIEALYK